MVQDEVTQDAVSLFRRRKWALAGVLLVLPGLPGENQTLRRPVPLFEETAAEESGVGWVHDNAMSKAHYLPETMSGGGAVLDYDGDGWMDLYLVNSGPSDFFTPDRPLRNALYRNNGDGSFTDMTLAAGVSGGTFGMGAAAADFDNDGYPDLLVTSYGELILYHNRGNGTFENITARAGVGVKGWTTSAVWFDYDNDKNLDLFVCSFVEFGVDQHISCGLNALNKAYYCVPRVFNPTSSLLFRNNGNGTFTEVGQGTAIGRSKGKALGVVAADVNNDRRIDLFVANDTVRDFLFLNRPDNRWEEVGVFAGVAFSLNGEVQSGMGVDAADFDDDGWQDLFTANIDHQYYSLFRNARDESFEDIGAAQGIAKATFLLSGWGLKFFDPDNDGDLDLFLANGHPDDMIDQYAPAVSYREPLLLFENEGSRLRDVSSSSGPVFSRHYSARGVALVDYDNDGRGDLLVINNGGPPLLLHNKSSPQNHWVGLRLEGVTCNREAIGARITWSAGGVRRSRTLNSGGSYLTSHDRRIILGNGPATRIDWIEIRWPRPSTRIERLSRVPLDRYLTVREGRGIVDGSPTQ
ncbi:MAG: CRTAC1 family protein [Acidobacteriota bacterium]